MSVTAAATGVPGLATWQGRHFGERGPLAELEELLGRARREQMHGPGDNSGPSRLMVRAEAGPVVAVEILVEQEKVPPVRVLLELPGFPVDRPPATVVPQEDVGQPARNLLGDLVQGHVAPGARGTFHGELLAVIREIL